MIGDHSVEFLVNSGSSVTAISGPRWCTGGNIEVYFWNIAWHKWHSNRISGCSHCVVSFMGLQTEFPILIILCDLNTDAIIGTDTLGSVLRHTLDIKNGLLFTEGASHFNCTRMTLLCWDAFSLLAIVQYPHTQMQYYIAPYAQWAAGPCPPADYWKDLRYLQKILALWWAHSCGSF